MLERETDEDGEELFVRREAGWELVAQGLHSLINLPKAFTG